MKYFYKGMVLEAPESVYCPREDSELMAEALEKEELKGRKCLEIGCGSGLLSIIMSKKGASVAAADINEEAVEATKKNAEANKAEVKAFRSDMFENVSGKFDLIAFNAPYLPAEEGESEEKTYYGGISGRETIERFAKEAKNFLNPGGKILLCISSLTGEEETKKIFTGMGLSVSVAARKKVPWEEIIVFKIF